MAVTVAKGCGMAEQAVCQWCGKSVEWSARGKDRGYGAFVHSETGETGCSGLMSVAERSEQSEPRLTEREVAAWLVARYIEWRGMTTAQAVTITAEQLSMSEHSVREAIR